MRTFTITGPCEPARHYMLPPRERLPDLQPLIDEQLYFGVRAPRQTGKTTAMRALAADLRRDGVAACWATVETAQGFVDPATAEPLWLLSRTAPASAGAPRPAGPPEEQGPRAMTGAPRHPNETSDPGGPSAVCAGIPPRSARDPGTSRRAR